MTNYLEKFNIASPINAAGKWTIYGGCRMFPRVAEAMAEAGKSYIELGELHQKAGEYIAQRLGVPAALVTAGAGPGMVQAAAGCIAGMDPYLRNRLPSNPPLRREIVIQRAQRNPYDNALQIAGAKLVEIGDNFKTHPWELAGAINENTAAVYFGVCSVEIETALSLEETIEIAHSKGIPVIMDAAPHMPPKSNLWNLVKLGCDLVVFSGGKDLRGPQASGLIVGKEAYVQAAAFNGAPNYGVGRPMKAGKEIVLGVVAAVDSYLEEDEEQRFANWRTIQKAWIEGLDGCGGWKAEPHRIRTSDLIPTNIPKVDLIPPDGSLASITNLAERLKRGSPMILVDQNMAAIVLTPFPLEGNEWEIVLQCVKRELENPK